MECNISFRQDSSDEELSFNNNRIVVYWTEEQCLYLINQRMERNDEFWALQPYNKTRFWRNVANKINVS